MTIVLFLTQQMNDLFCERLAACLHMRQPPPPLMKRPPTEILSVDVANQNNGRADNYLTISYTETADKESTKKLLEEIRDLLKNRVHSEEEQRHDADKENEMKNDWMLAAAVLDRICAICVTVIFFAGTVVMCIAFAIRS